MIRVPLKKKRELASSSSNSLETRKPANRVGLQASRNINPNRVMVGTKTSSPAT